MKQRTVVVGVIVATGVVAAISATQLIDKKDAPKEIATTSAASDKKPKVQPDSPETTARFARAFAEQRKGRLDDAITQYRALLEDQPKHVQVRFNLAHALMSKGQCHAALTEFKRVLELDPGRAAAHLHIAKCARDVGDLPVAQLHQATWEKSRTRAE